jgi:hypothetical protein
LQKACGEIEQAHGALLQRCEAMEAEREALTDRARDASILREQLERAQRDQRLAERAFTARPAGDSGNDPGLIATFASDAAGAGDEARWWSQALQEAMD